MDGEFACLDPYLGTNYHLLSDVKILNLKLSILNFHSLDINEKSNK